MMRKMSVKSYSNRWKNSKMKKSSCSQRVNKSKWLLKTIMQPKSPNNSQKTNKNPMYLKGSKILTMDRSHLIMIECQEKMMFFILFEETKKYHITSCISDVECLFYHYWPCLVLSWPHILCFFVIRRLFVLVKMFFDFWINF